MFRAYTAALAARKAAELEAKVHLATLPWGGLAGKGKKNKYSEDQAYALYEDPLLEFPDDVEYLNVEEVTGKMKWATKLPKGHVARWEGRRAHAALHGDPTQKRAAQNDYLWQKYLKLCDSGVDVTLGLLKYMVQVDAQRHFLYPNTAQLTEHNRKARKENMPLTQTDPAWALQGVQPPAWHVERLISTGKFEDAVGRLNSLMVFSG